MSLGSKNNCFILRSLLLSILSKSRLEAKVISLRQIKTAGQVFGHGFLYALGGPTFRIIER